MTVKEKLLSLKDKKVCVHCPEKWQADILGRINYELDNTYPKYIYCNPWYDYGSNTCITAVDVGNIGVYQACHYKIISFEEFMEDVKIEQRI